MALKNIEDIIIFYRKQPTYNPQFTKGKPNNIKEGEARVTKATNNIYGDFKNSVQIKTEKKYPKQNLYFNQNGPRKILHPTQKPVKLMEYLIKTYTNANETVLDFTMGSGSTMIACLNTNRKGIGIELDKHYFEIATKRINEASYELLTHLP